MTEIVLAVGDVWRNGKTPDRTVWKRDGNVIVYQTESRRGFRYHTQSVSMFLAWIARTGAVKVAG